MDTTMPFQLVTVKIYFTLESADRSQFRRKRRSPSRLGKRKRPSRSGRAVLARGPRLPSEALDAAQRVAMALAGLHLGGGLGLDARCIGVTGAGRLGDRRGVGHAGQAHSGAAED